MCWLFRAICNTVLSGFLGLISLVLVIEPSSGTRPRWRVHPRLLELGDKLNAFVEEAFQREETCCTFLDGTGNTVAVKH